MSRKYDIYDERGRKIGEAREEPSAAETAVGIFILLLLFWKLIEGITELLGLFIKFVIKHPKQALALFAITTFLVLSFSWYHRYTEYKAEQAEILAFQIQSTQTAEVIQQRQAQAASLFETPVSRPSTSVTMIDINSIASYRVRTVYVFSGPAYETEAVKRVEMVAEYTKEPLAVHTVMKAGEHLAEIVHIGDTEWFINSGIVLSRESGKPLPNFGKELVVLELSRLNQFYFDTLMLSGVRVNRYIIEKREVTEEILKLLGSENPGGDLLSIEQASDFKAEIYALENGLCMKYDIYIEGTINENKPDLRGAFAVQSELYDFNTPIVIKPPE